MGYKPDWQNQSMAKGGASTVKHGVQSRELFHGAKTVARFADGGDVDIADLPELREPTAADRGEAPAVEAPKKFGEAFKEAGASGVKEFEWQGKRYTTQLKEEAKAAPAPKKAAPEIEDGKFMDTSAPATARARADVEDENKIRNAKGGKFVQGATPSRQSTVTDTRTKEEKIKANKGGKFVQGATPS